jgi:hypothetical protein
MSATLALTESNMLAGLRAVLLSLIAPGTEVIEGEINRVPEPAGPDFVVMIPITRERLSTNVDTYDDIPGAGVKLIRMATAVTVQIDIHGPNSADNAAIVSAVFRDESMCDGLALSGFDIVPLYTSEPRQTPFINAEQQVEFRWAIDLTLQVNPAVTIPQDFADHVVVTLNEVDLFPVTPDTLLVGGDGDLLVGGDGDQLISG